MTNLKDVEKVANDFDNDLEKISNEIKRIQSTKCRLKKYKGKSSYENDMTKVLKYEQILKEARNLLEPKEKSVTTYDQNDIDLLDYDETNKAIKSIQSKKCLSKWLTTVENDNDTYRSAEAIEKMLLDHKAKLQPTQNKLVSFKDISTLIETIETLETISKDRILEMLNDLIK